MQVQQPLDRIKALIRLETVLVAVVLAAVAAAAFLYLQREDARDELLSLQERIAKAEGDINALRGEKVGRSEELAKKQGELARKREEADALEITEESEALPSRQEAIDLSAQLVNFAAGRKVSIQNLVTGQRTVSVAGVEFPAVTYALVAKGDPYALVEILYVIESVPTARIDKLKFARDPEDKEANQWDVTLNLTVVYQEKG